MIKRQLEIDNNTSKSIQITQNKTVIYLVSQFIEEIKEDKDTYY